MREQPILQFGNFRFDLEARLLTRGGHSLDLSPKASHVLAVLVTSAGRVVSKSDLLDIVWPGAPVEEGNLAVHVSALRRALGEDASTAAFIQTIPRRGYRFATPASRVRNDQPRDLCRIAAHYLQQQTSEGCRAAAAAYRECIANEPASVQARAGLANTLLFRYVLGDLGREEAVPPAQALLREAHEIDPRSAHVHLSRSRLLVLSDFQWQRSEEELHRALESADSLETRSVAAAWRGFDLVRRGDFQRGIAELRRTTDACPLSTYIWRMLADAHFLARDFQESAAVSRRAIRLHPSCALLHRALARALTALGDYGAARRAFRRAAQLESSQQTAHLAEVAYLDAVAGNRSRAATFLSGVHRQHVSPILTAEIHAALGHEERALDCVEQACRTRDWAIAGLKQNCRLDPIRNTPRYRSLVARLGI